MVILHIKDYGDLKIELDYQNAPNTSANFVSLVRQGFYNGLTFHRVIKNFMIQGGDPKGTGAGGPDYSIKGEFKINGFNNELRHSRGAISMARTADPNSAGSQFFICDKDDFFLDGQYAAFGNLVEGFDVLDKIDSTKTSPSDRPLKPVVIESAEAIDEPDNPVEKI